MNRPKTYEFSEDANSARPAYSTIRISYKVDGLEPIKQAHSGEWYDLRAAQDYDLKAGDFEYIDLGVCIELPTGFEAIMAPRSSTFKRWGILQANSIGVFDNAFKGDNDRWKMPVFATRDTHISKNDRVCQFRIQPTQQGATIIKVEMLGNPDRGGWGSTGAK